MNLVPLMKCQYCNSDLIHIGFNNWICKNHNNKVEIRFHDTKISSIIIYINWDLKVQLYYLGYFYLSDKMFIDITGKTSIKLPLDNKITPENVLERINTYLIFS